MSTQVDHIKAHLLAGKSITPAQAIAVYGTFRLAPIIDVLRQQGIEIDTVYKRDEMGKQYGEYRLRKPLTIGATVQVKPGHGVGLPKWVRTLSNAKVVGRLPEGTCVVRFQRGENQATVPMNNKELVRVD